MIKRILLCSTLILLPAICFAGDPDTGYGTLIAIEFKVDNEVLDFLSELSKKSILNEYLKVCKVNFDIMRHGAPTTAVATKVLTIVREEIKRSANDEFSQATEDLPNTIGEAIKANFPNSESIDALVQSLPQLVMNIQDLLRKTEVPQKKGETAERELADELRDNFPQDEVVKLGKSGETDIILQLRKDGFTTGIEVIVESKASTSWRRNYLDEVRGHMSNRGCKYGILSVQKCPQGANGFLTERFDEGTIIVASREHSIIAYSVLRSILLSEFSLGKKAVNLQAALADSRIDEAIKKTLDTMDYLESIRKHTRSIETQADGIKKDADAADKLIKMSIEEIQSIIHQALVSTPNEPITCLTDGAPLLDKLQKISEPPTL